MLVGEAAGMLFLGALADRRGHKLSLQIAALCYAAAFALTAPYCGAPACTSRPSC